MSDTMTALPLSCETSYQADFLTEDEALNLFNEIVTNFDVTNKTITMADGSTFLSNTGIYMFTDPELTSFSALNETWGKRSVWTPSLIKIRDRIKAITGVQFHVARCIYYRDGSEGVDFHRDYPAYGPTTVIASLSLGAEREFAFRSVTNPTDNYSISLANGSLLVMGKGSQESYEHSLPVDNRCDQPRLNLTFRVYERKDEIKKRGNKVTPKVQIVNTDIYNSD